MKPSPPARYPHRVTWALFLALLLLAMLFIAGTASELPPIVASHFDAAGHPNGFMSRAGYLRFVSCFAIGLPLLVVVILAAVYSRATDLKLPNRDYWLDPKRIGRTRAFLTAHGVWLGSLLVMLGCFVHWQVLAANRQNPPGLSNQSFASGLIAFLLATALWIGALMFAFRRPVGE